MPDSKVTTVTREHRSEAARLLGFEPAPSGWHLNVLAHRWVEGEPVPEWWIAEREQGALLPPVAQALADRDARIGELEGSLILSRNALRLAQERAAELQEVIHSSTMIRDAINTFYADQLAVHLGECSVARNPGCSPSLFKDGAELMLAREELDAVLSGDYTATLMLQVKV